MSALSTRPETFNLEVIRLAEAARSLSSETHGAGDKKIIEAALSRAETASGHSSAGSIRSSLSLVSLTREWVDAKTISRPLELSIGQLAAHIIQSDTRKAVA